MDWLPGVVTGWMEATISDSRCIFSPQGPAQPCAFQSMTDWQSFPARAWHCLAVALPFQSGRHCLGEDLCPSRMEMWGFVHSENFSRAAAFQMKFYILTFEIVRILFGSSARVNRSLLVISVEQPATFLNFTKLPNHFKLYRHLLFPFPIFSVASIQTNPIIKINNS